jgi:hypothetical protein
VLTSHLIPRKVLKKFIWRFNNEIAPVFAVADFIDIGVCRNCNAWLGDFESSASNGFIIKPSLPLATAFPDKLYKNRFGDGII